ncbi:fungal-specific transcription factor domain-containing protein [Trichoderma austrokoningii]
MQAAKSRSKRGCWTCRIRHRKCDESLPFCRECSNRNIHCHGYGSRPSWLDNQDQVRAELSLVKRAVKHNARLLHKAAAPASRGGPPLRSLSSKPQQPDADAVAGPEQALWASCPSQEMRYREAELIMLYLDYIFPIQYPYYTDRAELGGRGWLFWLLLNNRPLRQASMTLAALYQRTKFARGTDGPDAELIEYHTTALSAMRHDLSANEGSLALDEGGRLISFISSGCCLISFEILQGGSLSWQTHLDALSTVVSKMGPSVINSNPSSREQSGSPTGPAPPNGTTMSPIWRGMMYAKRFEFTKLLWFEILSTASTGVPPRLPYREWLDSEEILMADFVGCQNWVMRVIGDLSMIQVGGECSTPEEKRESLSRLEKVLQSGLEQLRRKVEDPPVSHCISRVFATGALVLLYVIQSTIFPSGTSIYTAVASVISELDEAPKKVSLRGVVWPICIAGAMAQSDQQPFFERLMTKILSKSTGKGIKDFGNCASVQRILRQCWTRRHENPRSDFTWRDAMEDIGDFPLLV